MPPPPPRLDRIQREVLDAIRDCGSTAIGIWKLLNALSAAQGPATRWEARMLRLKYWDALRQLLRARHVFRAGRHAICLSKPAGIRPEFRRRRSSRKTATRLLRQAASVRHENLPKQAVSPRQSSSPGQDKLPEQGDGSRLRASVSKSHEQKEGSTLVLSEAVLDANPVQLSENSQASGTGGQPDSSFNRDESQCAYPANDLSAAASELAMRPRGQKRKWTGWLADGARGYKGQRVLLPNGETAHLYGATRQKAIVTLDEGRLLGGLDGEPMRWTVLPVSELRLHRNPHAQLLGSRKRGVKERFSALKAQTARENGRRGGRPRKQSRPASVPAQGLQRSRRRVQSG